MLGSLIFEGLKDAIPIIAQHAPGFGKLLHSGSSLASRIALPLLEKQFGAGHGDLSSLVRAITSDPNAEDKLKDLESHSSWIESVAALNWANLTGLDLSLKLDFRKDDNISNNT